MSQSFLGEVIRSSMNSSHIKSFQETTAELASSGFRVLQVQLDVQLRKLFDQVFKGIILFGLFMAGSILVLMSSAQLIGEALALDPHWILLGMGTLMVAASIIILVLNKKGSS